MAHGGKRPGAGKKKGSKSVRTLEREAIINAYNQRAMGIVDLLLDSQITLARGQTFLYKIEKEEVRGPKGGISYRSKPPKLVTSQWEIENYLEGLDENGDPIETDSDRGATYYYLTTKEPSNMALDSILNRTLGKPKETLELKGVKKLLVDF